MPKWLPKSMKIGPKSDLEPTRVDCFSALWCFGARPKNHDFLMPLRWLKKSIKSIRKAPGGVSAVNDRLLELAGVPRAATRATRKEDKRKKKRGKEARGKGGKEKVEKRESWKGKVGKRERKRDLTRPWPEAWRILTQRPPPAAH